MSAANGVGHVDAAPRPGIPDDCPYPECPLLRGGGGGGDSLDRPQRISLRDLGIMAGVVAAGVIQWASLTGQISETRQQAFASAAAITQRLDTVSAQQADARDDLRSLRSDVIQHVTSPGHAVVLQRIEDLTRRLDDSARERRGGRP